jgi:hypothetical protein
MRKPCGKKSKISNKMRRKKSKFVSILGWSLIIISAIFLFKTSFGSFIQKALFPFDFIKKGLSESNPVTDFSVFSYVNLMNISGYLIFTATLIISVFFLKFKEWARKGMMVMLSVYLLIITLITVLIWATGDFMFSFTSIPVNSGFGLNIMLMTLKIFATIFNVALFIFIFWLVDKCNSDFIKKKFN